jgi:2-aminoethylphosphonate transport system permease protein
VLWRVRLPLLLPSLTAAAGLCFALSMGELSATMMLYLPYWTPLPVLVHTATDRGALFAGSALAVGPAKRRPQTRAVEALPR